MHVLVKGNQIETISSEPLAVIQTDNVTIIDGGGSIGFRGLAAMAGGELMLGAQEFFQMFFVAATILVGILIGYTIIRPEPGL